MKLELSDQTITTRLKRVEQLRRLCLALGKAKPLDKVEPQTAALSNHPLSPNAQSPATKTTQCKTP